MHVIQQVVTDSSIRFRSMLVGAVDKVLGGDNHAAPATSITA
jgi:hypothetical protein